MANPLKRITATLKTIIEAKTAIIEAARLESEVKAWEIAEASDLNHDFLRKLVLAANKNAYIRVTLRSGEVLEIFDATQVEKKSEKGSASW